MLMMTEALVVRELRLSRQALGMFAIVVALVAASRVLRVSGWLSTSLVWAHCVGWSAVSCSEGMVGRKVMLFGLSLVPCSTTGSVRIASGNVDRAVSKSLSSEI